MLNKVGQAIVDFPDWQIDVEAHTDSQPIGVVLTQRYPTNWELSSARASSAVRFFVQKLGIAGNSISARGFADTRPVESNDTAAGREKNRRIDIVLRQKD